uniref:Putative ribonuclease H-like domain-containing protein n=1 Tax=Tanacetum cinerariifolium TaxID=118510 RepID=A0A6L2MUR5_TANCI|nr:putative ribonuclease H-like domain-containing protein [Tanacetum cinerariifolium]
MAENQEDSALVVDIWQNCNSSPHSFLGYNTALGFTIFDKYHKPKVKPVPTGQPKVTPVATSKRKVKPVPTGKPKVTPVPTSKPHVSTPVPTGRPNRPFRVPTDRGYSPSVISGWWLRYSNSPLIQVLRVGLVLNPPGYVVPTSRVIVPTGRYIVPTGRVIVTTGRTRERKAKSTLLMNIPDEYLASFHRIKDAKTLWDAIKTRFGEGLDKRYDRFQRLLSLLEIHGPESTSSTNELNVAYSIYTATGHSSQVYGSSSYADELMDCKSARNSGNRSIDTGNAGYKGRNNGKRPAKKEDENALVVQERLEEEATETVFDNRSSDEENSLANDRFKKGKGYIVVPPPLTGNYMPPKFDLSFARLDNSIYKFKISETVTSLTKKEKDAPETSTACVEKPKEDRSSAPLIQDWDTDSVNDTVFTPEHIPAKIEFVKADESVKHVKPVKSIKPVKLVKTAEQTKKIQEFQFNMSHLIKDCTFHEDRMAKKSVLPNNVGKGTCHEESRPVWNNVQRINNQNKFAPTAVFTRSGRIPVSAAKLKVAASTSATKPVNTAGPKQSVHFSKSRSTFHKLHPPIRRYFYNATTHSRRNSTEGVNTARLKAISVVKGNRVTAIKTSAGCVWRPRVNVIYQISKENRWICTRVDYVDPQGRLKFQVTPKLSHLYAVKRIFGYLKGQPKLGLWYPRDSLFDMEAYSDSDYAGANLDRKSTTRGCQFLGKRLISWQCKEQTIVATSTTKAEDSYEKKLIQVLKIHTDDNVVDLLTKDFDVMMPGKKLVLPGTVSAAELPLEKGEGSGSGPGHQETMGGAMAQIRFEGALIHSIDPFIATGYIVRSREDMMEHDIELTDPVPQTPYDSPLLGGHTPGSDEGSMTLKELMNLCTTLLQKVLDLENVKTAQRNSLGRRKVSKQGRKNLKSQQMFQDNVLDEDADTEMIVEDKGNGEKGCSTAETVSTTMLDISVVRPENQKAKEKGIAFKDTNDSERPIRSITTLQPLPTIDPKDKGKGILQEPEPVKKSKKIDQDQIKKYAEVALKTQAHLNEEARIERERQEEASEAALAEMYDEVQAQIDDDHELAVRLTHEEQQKNTVEERSKLFTHAQLKSRSFEEIQKLYIMEQKWVDAFVLIGSEEYEKRIGSRKKREAFSSSKHKSPKKQKVNDQESKYIDKEHRKCLKVVPDEDKAINYKTLDVKSPMVDCESQVLGSNKAGDVHVYKLTRLDGSYRHFSTFSRMLEVLDRQDALDLHKIIMERFPANDPEGYNLILWRDLKTLVESNKRYPLTKEILEKMLSLRLEAETESTLALDLIKFIKLQIEEK